jgi:hypothetical protein
MVIDFPGLSVLLCGLPVQGDSSLLCEFLFRGRNVPTQRQSSTIEVRALGAVRCPRSEVEFHETGLSFIWCLHLIYLHTTTQSKAFPTWPMWEPSRSSACWQ